MRQFRLFHNQLFFFLSFSISIFICLFGCNPPKPNICLKNGQPYCVTNDLTYIIDWDSCYRRGLNCIKGKCWEYAVDEFKEAIRLRGVDKRNVWAHGLHFRDEYFPHRELGICYFHLNCFEGAIQELELSLSQTPSARAKYYLNQSRRSHLMATSGDKTIPTIHLEIPEEGYLTNQNPFHIKGMVKDDQFVAAISFNINKHEPNPLFIELAQPTISFTFPVSLEEGENTIEVIAKDLLNRKTSKCIHIYLDQQGPLVIVKPIRKNHIEESGKIRLTALVYDQSGITSFQLNNREVPRVGRDRLCLIEENIPTPPGEENILFWTQDRAGNITQGDISFLSARRELKTALQLACAELGNPIHYVNAPAQESNQEYISFNIICINCYKPEVLTPIKLTLDELTIDELVSPEDKILLVGKIISQNPIRIAELQIGQKKRELYKSDNKLINWQEIINDIYEQEQHSRKYYETVKDILQRDTEKFTSQEITLEEELTSLILRVEDNLGNIKIKKLNIRKIPSEKLYPNKQRMILAIVPFDHITEDGEEKSACDYDQDYIYNELIKNFTNQNRFNLVDQDKLPWEIIAKECRKGRMSSEFMAQEICETTYAEGVICGNIKKKNDGIIQVTADFREKEMGKSCLTHDVYSLENELKQCIFALADKFRTSFPRHEGNIIGRDRKFIQVDLGRGMDIFEGMIYNIFRDKNEKKLLGKAIVKEVEEDKELSKAKILEKMDNSKIKARHLVRVR